MNFLCPRFSASEHRRYAKLMVIICCLSHAVLAAVASTGPTPDIDQLQGVMDRLPPQLKIETMVADAGFDSAFNHRLLRETHGIRSTSPPEYGRPPKDPAALPTDKYRRLMKRRFHTRADRFRAQVKTVMSMLKRNLGAALSAKTYQGRCRELMSRGLTHNIMIALIGVFYRALEGLFLVLTALDICSSTIVSLPATLSAFLQK